MANVIEGIQECCNTIRDEIIPLYERIGPAGTIGKMLLQQQVKGAEAVIASGDVVQMITTLKDLRETCETAI